VTRPCIGLLALHATPPAAVYNLQPRPTPTAVGDDCDYYPFYYRWI
jgi:hypothetical protein